MNLLAYTEIVGGSDPSGWPTAIVMLGLFAFFGFFVWVCNKD